MDFVEFKFVWFLFPFHLHWKLAQQHKCENGKKKKKQTIEGKNNVVHFLNGGFMKQNKSNKKHIH